MNCVFVDICIMAVLAELSRKCYYNYTLGRMTMKSRHRSLGRLLICLHCSLITLLRTARAFHWLIHSLTRSFSPELMRKIYFYKVNELISCHFNPLCSNSAPAAPILSTVRLKPTKKLRLDSNDKQQLATFPHSPPKKKKKPNKKNKKKTRHKYRITHAHTRTPTHMHSQLRRQNEQDCRAVGRILHLA